MLPIALDLTGRDVLVIGAGKIGTRKAAQLLAEGAVVTIIAPDVLAPIPEGATVTRRSVAAHDLDGRFLVVAATGDPSLDTEIRQWASARGVLLNVADDPERCDFYFMAQHRAGAVVLAVSTEGAAPALAQELRDRAAAALPPHLAEVAAQLAEERHAIQARGESTEGIDWRPRINELLDGA